MEDIQLAVMTIIILGIPAFRRIFFHQASSTIANNSPLVNVKHEKRESFFDFIRGISILAVIWIHVVFVLQHLHHEEHNAFLILSNNVLRFSLPIFFITSGILLNPLSAARGKLISFYTKKIVRIIIPYILFNILILIVISPPQYGFVDFLYSLLTGNLAVPFYFVSVLFQLYLVYPVMVWLKKYGNEMLVGSFFISLLSALFLKENIGHFIHALPYLFFFVYGWHTREYWLSGGMQKHDMRIWVVIGLLSLVSMGLFFEKYYNIQLFYGTAIFSVFFYFKHVWTKIPWIFHGLSVVGRYSLWIFLTHFYIVLGTYLVLRVFDFSFVVLTFLVFVISALTSVVVSILCGYVYNQCIKIEHR